MTNPTPPGQVPEALRLAIEFADCVKLHAIPSINDITAAGRELRRLHAENTTLQQGYDAARLEIESRNKQLVKEAARTAEEKLRADRMTEQHRMQCQMREGLEREIEALRSRQCLHGISEPSGWRDIETAPKDAQYVLLRGKREQDVASGYWLQSAYAGNGAWIWPFIHRNPILWAPLPPSPSSADEGGSKT